MAEYDDLRTECLLGARILWRELRDVMGHVSSRLPDGTGFALKMVRIPPEPIDADSVTEPASSPAASPLSYPSTIEIDQIAASAITQKMTASAAC